MHPSLLLEVWREVGRHLELPDLMQRLFTRLKDALPISMLVVRRVDVAAGCIETVAACLDDSQPPPARTRTDSTSARLQALATWCRAGSAVQGRDEIASSDLTPLLPEPLVPDSALLVPLPPGDEDDETPPGVMLALVIEGSSLTPPERAFLVSLAEPFAAALANDTRIREMRRLREAAEAENRALLNRLGRPGMGDVIVGAETGLKPVLERVALVARSDLPVLILGETGSGKEVIARIIHSRSPRAAGPLIRVNCGAIPPDLVDSELFGHERGSFTGADRSHRGHFERAHEGTLLLDEISEMPVDLQVKLLRVLESGKVLRVGGNEPLKVNVRVIAASNRPAEQAVAAGKLREDLLYRLNVFPIQLPPLRDRDDDVVLLAEYFLEALNRESEQPKNFTRAALDRLRAHSWPGNVRELRNVVQRAFILAPNDIGVDSIPLGVVEEKLGRSLTVRVGTPIEEAERRLILATLEHCAGDKKKTAEVLKISLKTLYNRLNVYKP